MHKVLHRSINHEFMTLFIAKYTVYLIQNEIAYYKKVHYAINLSTLCTKLATRTRCIQFGQIHDNLTVLKIAYLK